MATLSGVALRLWCFDLAVKYDKVVFPWDADDAKKKTKTGTYTSTGAKRGRKKKSEGGK